MEFSEKDMQTLLDIYTNSRSNKDSIRFLCSLALHLSNTKANHRHLHTEIVASCRDYRLSRFEMHFVLPYRLVSSKVINIVTAYMCEIESECWYLPTQFGVKARLATTLPGTAVLNSLQIIYCWRC
ncbi:hypothetical protein M0R45_006622 [Rubus argutus]|uniref:Uncharacterized protein n=1 Tax=Rubus argutus TaxID=59490 RepID=A0AAW1YRF3_RUBAR